MDYYQRLQLSLDYIEENLKSKLSIKDISAKAYISPYHFQRLFQSITGYSVYGYIRARRLSEASMDLIEKDKSILDISMDYQYKSNEAFTRAFKSYFNISPSKFRKEKLVSCNTQKRINFSCLVENFGKQLFMVKPEIVTISRKNIVGYNYYTSSVMGKFRHEIPSFYQEFGQNQRYLNIPERSNPEISYGIPFDYKEDGSFSFLIGEESNISSETLRPSLILIPILGGRYARFTFNDSLEIDRKSVV